MKILKQLLSLTAFILLTLTTCTLSERAELNKKPDEYDSVFKINQYENIKLYYHPKTEPAIKLVEDYLRKAEYSTTKLLPKAKNEILTIKLDYDEKVFREIYPERVDSQGFYIRADNRINILVMDCYADILSISAKSDHFKDTVLHEYCHYKLRQFADYNKLSLDNIPTWFNEGIASYIGDGGTRQYNEPKVLIPLNNLQAPDDWTKYSNETKGSIYTQADYAVSQLIFTKGEEVIQEILLKTKTLNFESAFKAVVGISLGEYEKELEADMKRGWRKYHKLIPVYSSQKVDAVRIECLEDYIKANPNNINACFDLETLYSEAGCHEKVEALKNDIENIARSQKQDK